MSFPDDDSSAGNEDIQSTINRIKQSCFFLSDMIGSIFL